MGSPSRGARCASWALQRCPPAAEAGARGAAAAGAARRRSRRSCPGRAAAAHLAEALRRRGSPARPGMARVTTCHQRCSKYPQGASLTIKTTVRRVAGGWWLGAKSTSSALLPCHPLPWLISLSLRQKRATSFTARYIESARRQAHRGCPAIAGGWRLGRRGPVGVHAAHGRGGGPEVRAALGHAWPGGLRVAVILRHHRQDSQHE